LTNWLLSIPSTLENHTTALQVFECISLGLLGEKQARTIRPEQKEEKKVDKKTKGFGSSGDNKLKFSPLHNSTDIQVWNLLFYLP
jgi:hypothetical protein